MASKKKAMMKKAKGQSLSSKEIVKSQAPRKGVPIFQSGAGSHENKKRSAKIGKIKHQKRNLGY